MKLFLDLSNNTPIIAGQKDTIDIVCHSMGYAYALGYIEGLEGKVNWGRMYIIAPENACSGGADWTNFEEVWQYGSNNNPDDPDNRDPLNQQDGVAPQCAVSGIDPLPSGTLGGRAYIPPSVTNKGFLGSHTIDNYGWIFNLTSNRDGYVRPK